MRAAAFVFGYSAMQDAGENTAGPVCAAAGIFERAGVPGAGHQACETGGTSVTASAGVCLPEACFTEARFPAAEAGMPV